MASEDVRVQVKAGNVLLINSEERRVEVEGAKDLCMGRRRMGKFVRKFALPEKANTGKITTVSRDGVLTVTVEKLPPIEAKLEQLRSHRDERKLRIGAVDRLSMLPDELLLCILSLLSFKEATATSILCRRWRHLHTFTSKLDFDGIKISQKSFHMKPKDFEVLRQKFHSWVDGVVRLNQSSRLEKFSVRFYLRGGFFHTDDIDEWVRFALSKKVESLELFSPWASLAAFEKYYTLNFHKWDYDFNFMKKLVTHSVDVSGEAVEMLLRKCPLLEQVSIADSKQLLFLEIIKPFPAFRSLEILECMNLSSVLVDDSNIVSFKYHGNMVDKVVLVNVPLLTELWISGRCTKYAMGMLDMFSCVLPQLHTLKICINWTLRDFCIWFCTFVEMSNLKQLVVNTGDINFKEDLLPLANLVRALPGLQRFVIEEPYEKNRADDVVDVEVEPIEIADARSVDRILFRANTELKEVEFVGYLGVRGHFGLLRHFVENVDALETIVIDPWGFKKPDYAATFEQIPRRKYNHEIFARANALKHLVPSGINVRVLGLEH